MVLQRFYRKVISKISIEGMGIFEIVVANLNGHKNVQQRSLSESSANGKKPEKLSISLLDNMILNAYFKWQSLNVASFIFIWKWQFQLF